MNITNTTIPVLSSQNEGTQLGPIFTVLGCSLGAGAIAASCAATRGNLGPRVVQAVFGIGSAACLLANTFVEGQSSRLEARNASADQNHGLFCALGAFVPLCIGVLGLIKARLICTNEHRQHVMHNETAALSRRDSAGSVGLYDELEDVRLPTYEEALNENLVAIDSAGGSSSDYADDDPPPPYEPSQTPPPAYSSNLRLNLV